MHVSLFCNPMDVTSSLLVYGDRKQLGVIVPILPVKVTYRDSRPRPPSHL